MARAWALATALGALALLGAGGAVAMPRFEDVAASAGIHVLYPGEGTSSPAPMFTGGGVCWGDFDGDGLEDLFFTKTNMNHTLLRALLQPRSELYRNNGDGTFTNVSAGSGAEIAAWGLGCAVADYDADGDLDLYYSGFGEGTLLRNDGPFRFANATAAAGVSMEGKCAPHPCFTTGVSWADVNGDGCLDLYLANYGNYTGSSPYNPAVWPGQANTYFESGCDGAFADLTHARNLDDDPGPNHSRSYMPIWCDYDADGRIDVYVAADGSPNSLLRQNADGTFTDVAAAAGVADTRAGMGLVVDDVGADGACDLYVTHYVGEHNGFYENRRDGTFRDRSAEGALANAYMDLGWGASFADVDNDGRKDIFVVNGHTSFRPELSDMARRLWTQRADGGFDDASAAAGPGITMRTNARGAAAADFDFDGDLDFVVENVNNQTANLLRASNVTGNWLEVQLRDPTGANRFAVGAVVTVRPEGLPAATRILHGGGSFLSQESYTLHFGLGAASRADVAVRWPDGATSTFADVAANRVVRATRGAAALEEDVLAPVSRAEVAGATRGAWFVESATVTLEADDRGVTRVSGVARIDVDVDGAGWRAYAGPFALGEGAHVVRWRAVDAAGNAEPARERVVRVDATPPTVSLAVAAPERDGWLTALPRLDAAGEDATSGVAAVELRVDGGAWRAHTRGETLAGGDGARVVEARVTDAAGHATIVSRAFRVDATPPATTLALLVGPVLDRGDVLDVTGDTRLALEASDGAGAGVAERRYRVDGAAWRVYSDAEPLAFEGPDRAITLEFASTDAMGHEGPVVAREVFLDNDRPPEVRLRSPLPREVVVGPVGALSLGPATFLPLGAIEGALGEPGGFATVAAEAEVRADAGPDVSGVRWIRVLVDGHERARAWGDSIVWTWDAAHASPGFHVLAVEAKDGRGNVGRVELRVLVLGPLGDAVDSAPAPDAVPPPPPARPGVRRHLFEGEWD